MLNLQNNSENSETNFPSQLTSNKIMSKNLNTKTTFSNSISENETIINEEISLENIDSSDIKFINLKTIKYCSFHQKEIIHKWYKIINCLIIIINIKKIKTQPLTLKSFNLMIEQLKKSKNNNKNIDKNIKDSIINSSNEKFKDENSKFYYIKDQIRLFQLIEYGYDKYLKEIEDLLKKNGFVNEPNYKKITPLFAACMNGYSEIAKVIIDNGGNYLKINCDGESILDIAVRFNYINLVKFLLNYCKWPDSYIKKSKKYIENETIEKNFKLYEKKKQKFYCFCLKKN